jgi:tetratricopeptide (TPR) repeat protein
MIMSRATATGGAAAARKAVGPKKEEQTKKEKLADYLKARDYTGALAMLEFHKKTGEAAEELDTLLWIGYCAFHLGQFQRAFDAYQDAINGQPDCPPEAHLYQAACLFYLQMYKPCEDAARAYENAEQRSLASAIAEATGDEALAARRAKDRAGQAGGSLLSKGRSTAGMSDGDLRATVAKELGDAAKLSRGWCAALKTRLLFHLSHRVDDQEKLMVGGAPNGVSEEGWGWQSRKSGEGGGGVRRLIMVLRSDRGG